MIFSYLKSSQLGFHILLNNNTAQHLSTQRDPGFPIPHLLFCGEHLFSGSLQDISSFSSNIVGVLLFFIVPNYVNQCSTSLNIQDEYNKSYMTIILSSVVMKIFRGLITVLECHWNCKPSRSKCPIAFHHRFS